MTMTLIPPPERDLPRHEQHRRTITMAVADRPRRPARLVPVAAAAGVVAVAAASAVAVGVSHHGPPASPDGRSVKLNAARLYKECVPARAAPVNPPRDVSHRSVLAMYADSAGGEVVIGNDKAYFHCVVLHDGHASFGSPPLLWSDFPFAIPESKRITGGVDGIVYTEPGRPPALSFVVVGRAGPDIARVMVTWTDGSTSVAGPSNGVFVARRVIAPPAGTPDGPVDPWVVGRLTGAVVRGYDRSGRLIMTAELVKER